MTTQSKSKTITCGRRTKILTQGNSNTDAVVANPEWSWTSLSILFCLWGVLDIGGLFSPGLLDDVDSVYIQIAREMLSRHDFVTPTVDGIRFFDKPPLMYWIAAASMRVFGIHDWAARLPLALGVLALLVAVYALGVRLFRCASPMHAPDRGGLYAAIAIATSIGPYLYTRFYIPDILIALWMTLSVHLFLVCLERVEQQKSSQWPGAAFGATLALSLLTKGFIGVVFPFAFVVLYLVCKRRTRTLWQLPRIAATTAFLLVAAPWHFLAALRNPPIAMPAGVGLPAHAGWSWFYLYNEHIARFLGKRIPHDYGQVPIPLFWLLLVLWLLPWTAFLPAALVNAVKELRSGGTWLAAKTAAGIKTGSSEAALTLLLWAGIILGFFTLSSRQEYYHLPALPALALLVGGLLAAADRQSGLTHSACRPSLLPAQALRGSMYFLVPFGTCIALICGYLAVTSPAPQPGADLNKVLSTNPDLYNLSLGHVFDLKGEAMGFFRGPLAVVSICMLCLGPLSHLLRRRGKTHAANLLVACSMTGVLLAAHEGLVRFYPILGSKGLALAVDRARKPGDLMVVDGELTAGSTLLFYTGQQVLLVNGHVNGPWFGSFWPDAPKVFLNDADLHRIWAGSKRVFLLTYHPQQRKQDLGAFGPVVDFGDSGGKTILTNKP